MAEPIEMPCLVYKPAGEWIDGALRLFAAGSGAPLDAPHGPAGTREMEIHVPGSHRVGFALPAESLARLAAVLAPAPDLLHLAVTDGADPQVPARVRARCPAAGVRLSSQVAEVTCVACLRLEVPRRGGWPFTPTACGYDPATHGAATPKDGPYGGFPSIEAVHFIGDYTLSSTRCAGEGLITKDRARVTCPACREKIGAEPPRTVFVEPGAPPAPGRKVVRLGTVAAGAPRPPLPKAARIEWWDGCCWRSGRILSRSRDGGAFTVRLDPQACPVHVRAWMICEVTRDWVPTNDGGGNWRRVAPTGR